MYSLELYSPLKFQVFNIILPNHRPFQRTGWAMRNGIACFIFYFLISLQLSRDVNTSSSQTSCKRKLITILALRWQFWCSFAMLHVNLTDRMQIVFEHGKTSNPTHLRFGVSQGTIIAQFCPSTTHWHSQASFRQALSLEVNAGDIVSSFKRKLILSSKVQRSAFLMLYHG